MTVCRADVNVVGDFPIVGRWNYLPWKILRVRILLGHTAYFGISAILNSVGPNEMPYAVKPARYGYCTRSAVPCGKVKISSPLSISRSVPRY